MLGVFRTDRRLIAIGGFVGFLLIFRIGWLFLSATRPEVVTPDELTFSELASHIGEGGDPFTWSDGWGASIYPQSRSLVIPAAWLSRMGLDPLTAVRVVSSSYAVGAVGILVGLLAWGRAVSTPPLKPRLPTRGMPIIGLAIFILLPSHWLWSSLALREAAIDFWILVAVLGLALITTRGIARGQRVAGAFLVALGVSLTLQTRPFNGWILGLALVLGSFPSRRKQLAATSVVLIGVMGGVFAAEVAAEYQAEGTVVRQPLPMVSAVAAPVVEVEPSPSARTLAAAPLASQNSDPPTFAPQPVRTAEAHSPLPLLDASSEQLGRLARARWIRAQGAISAFDAGACLGSQHVFDALRCEVARFPKAVTTVAVRPLWPWDDWASSSSTSRFAALENSLWLALMATSAVVAIRRKSLIPRVQWAAYWFILLTLGGMALTEGNLGTAFRHKSVILWALCVPLVLASTRRTLRQAVDRHTGAKPASSPTRI